MRKRNVSRTRKYATDADELRAALTLSRLPGVGAARFRSLLADARRPTKALALAAPQASLFALDGDPHKNALDTSIEAALAWVAQPRRFATWPYEKRYPVSLLDLAEPPPVLFVEGTLTDAPRVALVGARACSPAGAQFAAALAEELAEEGCVIVSGGALGIDAAAHAATLDAAKNTIAVLGHGPDVVYPEQHATLFSRIAARGALVTEFMPGAPPQRSFFVTRNRIIAGLADAVVVIEGTLRSGSRVTARHAQTLARPLFTAAQNLVPRDLDELPAKLRAEGARPASAKAILDALANRRQP